MCLAAIQESSGENKVDDLLGATNVEKESIVRHY